MTIGQAIKIAINVLEFKFEPAEQRVKAASVLLAFMDEYPTLLSMDEQDFQELKTNSEEDHGPRESAAG